MKLTEEWPTKRQYYKNGTHKCDFIWVGKVFAAISKSLKGRIPGLFCKIFNTITNVMSKTGREAVEHTTPGMQQHLRSSSSPRVGQGGEDLPGQPCQKCGTFSLERGLGASGSWAIKTHLYYLFIYFLKAVLSIVIY